MPEATNNISNTATPQASAVPNAVVAPRPRVKTVARPVLSHADSSYFGLLDTANDGAFVLTIPSIEHSKYKSVAPDTCCYLPHAEVAPRVALEAKPLGQSVLGGDALWIFGVVVAIFAVLGLVKARSQGFFSVLFSSLFSDSNWRTLCNNADLHFYWPLRVTRIIAICLAALLIYEVMLVNGHGGLFGLTNFVAYAFVLVALVLFYWLRNFVDYLIGYAFDCSKTMTHVLQAKGQSLSLMSVVILPLVLIFPFVQERFYDVLTVVAIVIASLGALGRLFRMLQIISLDMVSLSYYILYLCAVEIAPLLCLLRVGQIGAV